MSAEFYVNAGEPNSKMSEVVEKKIDTDADSWESGAFFSCLFTHKMLILMYWFRRLVV